MKKKVLSNLSSIFQILIKKKKYISVFSLKKNRSRKENKNHLIIHKRKKQKGLNNAGNKIVVES